MIQDISIKFYHFVLYFSSDIFLLLVYIILSFPDFLEGQVVVSSLPHFPLNYFGSYKFCILFHKLNILV